MKDWTYCRPLLWAIAIVKNYTLPLLGGLAFWLVIINVSWALRDLIIAIQG